MRIIGGEKRGTKLAPVNTDSIRPTPDSVREAVFNILQTRVPGARVLSPFAGTGAMGLEALSRGADYCVFIENSKTARRIISKNIIKLRYEPSCRVLPIDAFHSFPVLMETETPFDLIFIDPPYLLTTDLTDDNEVVGLIKKMVELKILAPEGLVILDHPKKARVQCNWEPLEVVKQKRYGKVALEFLCPIEKTIIDKTEADPEQTSSETE